MMDSTGGSPSVSQTHFHRIPVAAARNLRPPRRDHNGFEALWEREGDHLWLLNTQHHAIPTGDKTLLEEKSVKPLQLRRARERTGRGKWVERGDPTTVWCSASTIYNPQPPVYGRWGSLPFPCQDHHLAGLVGYLQTLERAVQDVEGACRKGFEAAVDTFIAIKTQALSKALIGESRSVMREHVTRTTILADWMAPQLQHDAVALERVFELIPRSIKGICEYTVEVCGNRIGAYRASTAEFDRRAGQQTLENYRRKQETEEELIAHVFQSRLMLWTLFRHLSKASGVEDDSDGGWEQSAGHSSSSLSMVEPCQVSINDCLNTVFETITHDSSNSDPVVLLGKLLSFLPDQKGLNPAEYEGYACHLPPVPPVECSLAERNEYLEELGAILNAVIQRTDYTSRKHLFVKAVLAYQAWVVPCRELMSEITIQLIAFQVFKQVVSRDPTAVGLKAIVNPNSKYFSADFFQGAVQLIKSSRLASDLESRFTLGAAQRSRLTERKRDLYSNPEMREDAEASVRHLLTFAFIETGELDDATYLTVRPTPCGTVDRINAIESSLVRLAILAPQIQEVRLDLTALGPEEANQWLAAVRAMEMRESKEGHPSTLVANVTHLMLPEDSPQVTSLLRETTGLQLLSIANGTLSEASQDAIATQFPHRRQCPFPLIIEVPLSAMDEIALSRMLPEGILIRKHV